MLTTSQQICLRELGNVLVVAGAGTGKTILSVLLCRVLHVLSGQEIALSESPQGQEARLSPARWRIAVLAG